jgi:hypothetical protein
VSAEAAGQSGTQPWQSALTRLEDSLDRLEARLAAREGDLRAEPLPTVEGDLPEHLADRARDLLARTDAVTHLAAAELTRTRGELRELEDRVPAPAPLARRGQHPAYLDTRA